MKYILIGLVFASSLFAQHNEQLFKELLLKVKKGYNVQTYEDKQREQKFLREVQNQQKIITKLKVDIKNANRLSTELKNRINVNEKSLQKLSNELDLATGDLGEVFGTVKQISSDMNVHIKNSLITSQFKERTDFLTQLSSKKELPQISELEKLWFITFQEIIESGKVAKYNTEVVSKEGTKENMQIVRLGNFNAITEDSFLQYNAKNKLFIEPSTQPGYRYTRPLDTYFNSQSTIEEVIVDPTRGTILDVMSQKPSFRDRIDQGGVIGYIIILIGFIGVLFAIGKYFWISSIGFKVKKQAKDLSNIRTNNPLGRITQVYEEYKNKNINDLEYKVDEAFYKEIPSLQSGFSMIKLFAATAPLLGLLGTVTGMILTFQSITLFGTSDPKLMAGGISQALITTMLGLITAIPLLFAHTLLNAKAKKIINILEQHSLGLVAKKMESNV